MKYLLYLLFIPVMFISCGGDGENTSSDSDEESPSEISADGPDVEFNVLSFDIENKETVVEVVNRLDEDIVEVKGDLCFLDSAGNALNNIFGNQKSTHFQQIKNPKLCGSMERAEFTLGNRIDTDVQGIEGCNIIVETTSGKEVEVE